jgi:hypothetical protein
MLIIPKLTGLPLAALGVPSAALLADVAGAELALVAPLEPLDAAEPPELEPELEELPHAVNPTAATAHAPTIAPRFLSNPFISPSLWSVPGGARKVSASVNGAMNCAPSRETYTVAQSVCK